jgi:WD40 repeat protein
MLLFDVSQEKHPIGQEYLKAIMVFIPLVIILLIGLSLYMRVFVPEPQPPLVQKPEPFVHPLILSLGAPVEDSEGIPYSGTVQYNPVTEMYSYIAIEDEGLVTPISPDAFAPRSNYLAMRANDEGIDLLIYDSKTLAPVRTVDNFDFGGIVTHAVWSPDGKRFAYRLVGVERPGLMIESFDEASDSGTPGFDRPIGFSPDGTGLLTRGVNTPVIIDIVDLGKNEYKYRETAGVASDNPETVFLLSPSGNLLASISSMEINLYLVDWDSATFGLLSTVNESNDINDALFASDDLLMIHKDDVNEIVTYAYTGSESGDLQKTVYSLSLPDQARILRVLRE